MKTYIRTMLVLTAIAVAPAPALADCWYNGSQKAEGTKIGDRVCQNGRWVPG